MIWEMAPAEGAPIRTMVAGGVALVVAALVVVLTLGVSWASASAVRFGSEGAGAGQFAEPRGIAVEQGAGAVYVVDRNNQRVEKFTKEGAFVLAWGWGVADGNQGPETCTSTCREGVEGTGQGQFSFPEGVALDNDLLSASHGDVYVVDVRNNRVEKFGPAGEFKLMFGGGVDKTPGKEGDVCTAGEQCGAGTTGPENGQFEAWPAGGGEFIAVGGPEDDVYVGDENRVQEFNEAGAYKGQVTLAGAGRTRALAVDSEGNLYVESENLSGIHEYSPAGVEISSARDATGQPVSGESVPVTVDRESGALFADDGASHHILGYDKTGGELVRFPQPGGGSEPANGIALVETGGPPELYDVEQDVVRTTTPPPPGPLVLSGSESAKPGPAASVTLGAFVNPEGGATSYRFEYGPALPYAGATTSTELAASFEDEPVNATVLSGLQASTTYHYRIIAMNAAGRVEGPDQTFTTLPAAAIDSLSVADVTGESATLEAEINPLGSDTSYHFQYGPTTSCGTGECTVPIPDADIGSGTADVPVSAHVRGLQAGTPYHYRVVAANTLGTEQSEQSFTTQPPGTALRLPDGRAWELVSPPDKGAAALQPAGAFGTGGLVEASAAGDAIAYISRGGTEPAPQGEPSPEMAQIFGRHGAGGWESRDIATAHEREWGFAGGHSSEYQLFSQPSLALALVEPPGATPLSSEASERTPYLRRQALCEVESSAGECYLPLVTAMEGFADIPTGTKFGEGGVRVQGATPDLGDVVLSGGVPLTPGAAAGGLYEWTAGRLQLLSVLPAAEGGTPVAGSLGYATGSARDAISKDGSRVFWTSGTALYMREVATEATVRLDVVQPGVVAPGSPEPRFQIAAADGSKVFFTDTQRLTTEATAAATEPDLYEYDVVSRELTDLTVPVNPGERADMQGVVLGAGGDGTDVYLVAHGVLTGTPNAAGAQAHAGADNLYVVRDEGGVWRPTFIATLSGEDAPSWEGNGIGLRDLTRLTAEVSPSGEWLAFMSNRSLTGYDNLDAGSGLPDEEVYLYDAAANRVVCASCDPTGARPAGVLDTSTPSAPLVDRRENWKGLYLAASIPGWTPFELDGSVFYQSRYLFDSGRLFFNAEDALVPQDTNHTADVYEYEPAGVGSCTAASTTFSPRSGGCAGLISSGASAEESVFLDASASGDDAFFLTAARLVPQDTDTALDVYDAHVCGSGWQCSPASGPVSPPPCESVSSCGASAGASMGDLGPPASVTFSGAGNLAPQSAPPAKVAKSTRARRLSSALRACGKLRRRTRRRACETRTKRAYAYGAKQTGKPAKKGKK